MSKAVHGSVTSFSRLARSGYETSSRARQREDAEADALDAQRRDLEAVDASRQTEHDASVQRLVGNFAQLEEAVSCEDEESR